jgi:DNA-binding beta-propeller fold protein YncE
VDPETNELYIADGYTNHRIIVVDARTGMYKRHWGAYGQNPVSDAPLGGYIKNQAPAPHFRNPVHAVRITDDGLVYVADRTNDRIQVFDKKKVGAACQNPTRARGVCGYVGEFFVAPDTLGPGSTWDVDVSSDKKQKFLYNADGSNNYVWTLLRKTGAILGTFGRNGRNAGQFHWVHNLAVDSKGNMYTAEVDTSKRVQKFKQNDSDND